MPDWEYTYQRGKQGELEPKQREPHATPIPTSKSNHDWLLLFVGYMIMFAFAMGVILYVNEDDESSRRFKLEQLDAFSVHVNGHWLDCHVWEQDKSYLCEIVEEE